jgi:hypothetical protein
LFFLLFSNLGEHLMPSRGRCYQPAGPIVASIV